jgi:hypothetical protein
MIGKHLRMVILPIAEEKAVITVELNGTTNKRMKSSVISKLNMITHENGNMQISPLVQYSITMSINLILLMNFATVRTVIVLIVNAEKIKLDSHKIRIYEFRNHRDVGVKLTV